MPADRLALRNTSTGGRPGSRSPVADDLRSRLALQVALMGRLEDRYLAVYAQLAAARHIGVPRSVVQRLLAGEELTGADLRALGHGGLLSDPRRG